MKNIMFSIITFFLLLCSAQAAPISANTIDFNVIPLGTGLDGNPVTIDDVVFDGWVMGFGIAAGAAWVNPSITFASTVTSLGFDYYSLADILVAGQTLNASPFGSTFSMSTPVTALSFQIPLYSMGIVLDNLTYTPQAAATPIPGALALLGAGIFGIAGLRKKFQR